MDVLLHDILLTYLLGGKRKLLEEKQQAKELLEIQERRLTENIEIKKLLYEEMNTNIIPVKAKVVNNHTYQ